MSREQFLKTAQANPSVDTWPQVVVVAGFNAQRRPNSIRCTQAFPLMPICTQSPWTGAERASRKAVHWPGPPFSASWAGKFPSFGQGPGPFARPGLRQNNSALFTKPLAEILARRIVFLRPCLTTDFDFFGASSSAFCSPTLLHLTRIILRPVEMHCCLSFARWTEIWRGGLPFQLLRTSDRMQPTGTTVQPILCHFSARVLII